MLAGSSQFVSALREELIARKGSYAVLNGLPHATSYGELPVVVYQQSECGEQHGRRCWKDKPEAQQAVYVIRGELPATMVNSCYDDVASCWSTHCDLKKPFIAKTARHFYTIKFPSWSHGVLKTVYKFLVMCYFKSSFSFNKCTSKHRPPASIKAPASIKDKENAR